MFFWVYISPCSFFLWRCLATAQFPSTCWRAWMGTAGRCSTSTRARSPTTPHQRWQWWWRRARRPVDTVSTFLSMELVKIFFGRISSFIFYKSKYILGTFHFSSWSVHDCWRLRRRDDVRPDRWRADRAGSYYNSKVRCWTVQIIFFKIYTFLCKSRFLGQYAYKTFEIYGQFPFIRFPTVRTNHLSFAFSSAGRTTLCAPFSAGCSASSSIWASRRSHAPFGPSPSSHGTGCLPHFHKLILKYTPFLLQVRQKRE